MEFTMEWKRQTPTYTFIVYIKVVVNACEEKMVKKQKEVAWNVFMNYGLERVLWGFLFWSLFYSLFRIFPSSLRSWHLSQYLNEVSQSDRQIEELSR